MRVYQFRHIRADGQCSGGFGVNRGLLALLVAALVFLSAANWAYTWLQAGRDTDDLADRFFALLVDGMRGYATPAG